MRYRRDSRPSMTPGCFQMISRKSSGAGCQAAKPSTWPSGITGFNKVARLQERDYYRATVTMNGGKPGHRVSGRCVADQDGLRRFLPITCRKHLTRVVFCAIVLASCGATLRAQKSAPAPIGTPVVDGPSTGSTSAAFRPGYDPFDDAFNSNSFSIVPTPADTADIMNAEVCNSWTEAGVKSPTVSTIRLAVPDKASSEYQKACSAYKSRNLQQAEEHVRNAIKLYANYVPAWVVLGQVLDAEHKRPEARTACSQAMNVDPTYVAPYLCLAQFAATENDWDQVEKLSGRALALDPVNNPYSLFYTADAGFHLNQIADAEKNALAAVQLDIWHHMPEVHLLLAQVYATKGDLSAEMTQLKEYLKLAPDAANAAEARTMLARLQSPGSGH